MAFSMKMSALTTILVASVTQAEPSSYPVSERERLKERRFGHMIADPYRWMENPHDPRLEPWIRAQNQHVDQALAGRIHQQLVAEYNEIFAVKSPQKREVDELEEWQQQYRFMDHRQRFRARFSTPMPTRGTSPSERYHWQLHSDSSGDFKILTIADTGTTPIKVDTLRVKFASLIWQHDEGALVYFSDRDGRVAGSQPSLRRHVIGTKQHDDKILWEASHSGDWADVLTIDERHFLWASKGQTSTLYAIDLKNGQLGESLFELADNRLIFFSAIHHGDIVLTNFRDQPMGEVTAFNIASKTWRTVVSAQELPVDDVYMVGDDIYLTYLKDAAHVLYRYHPERGIQQIAAPKEGRLSLIRDEPLQFGYVSYSEPGSIWELSESRDHLKLVKESQPADFPIVSKKLFYRAHTGSQAVIRVIHRQGVELNGDTPTYMYGYGGFNINILPYFSSAYLPWLRRGGVVAVVTLPGGGEYGRDWYLAGQGHNKSGVFVSFASAARQLIKEGVTNPRRLGIGGASNGGLLVGASLALYPELFAAGVPEVGVLDMTRFSLFTGGKWWIREYGDRNDVSDFRNLLSVSPLHLLHKTRSMPATLVMTADHDDRVVPAHSYKFAATLQNLHHRPNDAFLHVMRGGSHGSMWTGPREERVRYFANKWTFLMTRLGL